MIIDVHTHYMTDNHWGTEFKDHWLPVYGNPWIDVTPQAYDEAMREVDVALVFGITARAAGVSTPIDAIADFCEATTTATIGFMSIDLSDDDVLDQVEHGVERGLKGVKLYQVLAGFDPADRRHDAFYEAATRHGLVLLWHVGATPSPIGHLQVSHPLVIDEVARRHPNLTQIMAHMGHPWQREALIVLRKNRRVFSDVSASWSRPLDGWFALARAKEWGVADRLLFGSDYPLWTPREAIDGLKRLAEMRVGDFTGPDPDMIEELLHRDALALLELDHPNH